MKTIGSFMGQEHRHCDDAFVATEQLAQTGDWRAAQQHFDAFQADMLQHFVREESILFPAFERAMGNRMGPTKMMLHEHEQIRVLMMQLANALLVQDEEDWMGHAETLLIVLQQHNIKEEQVLYPMAEQVLQDDAGCVLDDMVALG